MLTIYNGSRLEAPAVKVTRLAVSRAMGKECLKSYETPTKVNWEPELDEPPLLDKAGKKLFQRLVGIEIWLVYIGRFDVHFVINQLSRFTQASREGYVEDAIRVFGFLQKWRNRGVKRKEGSTVSFWNQLDSKKINYPGKMKDYYKD